MIYHAINLAKKKKKTNYLAFFLKKEELFQPKSLNK